jgi:hypothetical protein
MGRIYRVRDTVHLTGGWVHLIILGNYSSGALTAENRCLAFSEAAAKYFGRAVSGWNTVAANICVPMDDKYLAGLSIPRYDLFYGVIRGFCNIKTETTAVALAAQTAVTVDGSGYIEGVASTAGQFIVGTIDQASGALATAVRIFVELNLALSYGSK